MEKQKKYWLTALLVMAVCAMVSAQNNANDKPVIHGAFAYIFADEHYDGWKPVENYSQYTCRYCHKTITSQKFSDPNGDTVILYSEEVCPASPDGKHLKITIIYNLDGTLQSEKPSVENKGSSDRTSIAESKNHGNSSTGTDSPESTPQPIHEKVIAGPEPGKNVSYFNIDSVYIDQYFTFYYNAINISSGNTYKVDVKISNPKKSKVLYEESFSIVFSAAANQYIVKPAGKIEKKIHDGYIFSITISNDSGLKLKSSVSKVISCRKQSFKVCFNYFNPREVVQGLM
jgi:hypothetical protein